MPTALIRKIDVVWSGLAGAPYFTQFFYGHEAGQATSAAAQLRAFLASWTAVLATGLNIDIQPEQSVIDTASGKPVAVEIGGAQGQITCSGPGDPLPWATQVVLRLPTAQFNNGRRLRGHIFIPGPVESQCTNGVLPAAALTSMNTWVTQHVSNTVATGKWAVWSRAHSGWASIESPSVWPQFGVLRRRRP